MQLSLKAQALIFEFEGCDLAPSWAGGESGVDIGFGYDLGYEGVDDFRRDWSPYLPAPQMQILSGCCGLKGTEAHARVASLKSIRITAAAAEAVFLERSVPKYMAQLSAAFPGVEALPEDAIGALFSLIYNRGAGMEGDSRQEMRGIRAVVGGYAKATEEQRRGNLLNIADFLRSMKRLWKGKGLDGLLKRRDAEAALVESSIPAKESAT